MYAMRQLSSMLDFANSGAALAAAALLVLPMSTALADDPLGLYVGAGIGEAKVEASPGSLVSSAEGELSLAGAGDFSANHSAYKFMAGIRPIPIVGAEVEYIDFGSPNGNLGSVPANVNLKGAAAFAVAYLPVTVVDIMVKAGLARLDNTLSGSGGFNPVGSDISTSSLFRLDRTNTNFAVGGAVQYTIGSLAVRAEYERFEAAGGSPSMLTAGLTWTFF
jgi:opacity protein-like surface antigen